MKPLFHARISARRWGGEPTEYLPIHNWFDQTKAHIADARHRMLLHNAFGIYLCEQVFGTTLVLSTGKEVCVRDIAEQHVLDDLGCIPSLSEVFADVAPPGKIVGRTRITLPVSAVKIVD